MGTIESQHNHGDGYEWAHRFDQPVGTVLSKAREYYGLSITDVEHALHIRGSYLEALESGDMTALPGRVYAVGFIRAYSDFLQLDSDKILYLFKQQYLGNAGQKPVLHFPIAASESKAPTMPVIAGSIVALVLILGGLLAVAPSKHSYEVPAAEQVMAASDIKQNAGDVMEMAQAAGIVEAIEPAAGDAAAPAMDRQAISLLFHEKSWVEITNQKGDVVLSKVFQPDETYDVDPHIENQVLNTGNLGGFTVMIGETDLPVLGQSGDIGRNITLDVASLRERTMQDAATEQTDAADMMTADEQATQDRAEPAASVPAPTEKTENKPDKRENLVKSFLND